MSNNYWAPQNNEFLNQVVAISIQGIIKRMLVIIHLQQAHHRVIYSQGIIRYAFFLHIRNKKKTHPYSCAWCGYRDNQGRFSHNYALNLLEIQEGWQKAWLQFSQGLGPQS